MKYIAFFILFSASFCASLAQNAKLDSLAKDTIPTTWFYLNTTSSTDSLPVDSSFSLFKGYNHIRKFPTLNTGFAGGANYSPLLNRKSGQPTLLSGYENYFRQTKNVTYFYSPNPYSEATYINGGGREEYFNLIHSQNFGESLNVKIDFNKQGSEGFYNQQRTNHTYFDLSTNFQSRYGVYGFFAHFLTNRFKAEENGGFPDFEDLDNPELTGTSNLESALNSFQSNQYFVHQYVRFGKFTRSFDEDSLEVKSFKPILELAYTLKYDKGFRKYEDDLLNLEFYPNTYYNFNSTFDSIGFKSYENSVALSLIRKNKPWLSFTGGHEFYDYFQDIQVDTSYNNFKAGGLLNLDFQSFKLFSQVDYYLEGYNAGDLIFLGRLLKQNLSDTITSPELSASFAISRIEPHYYLTRYRSNNFQWSNSFNKSFTTRLSLGAKWYGFNVVANISNLNDYIYFNENALPEQNDENIQVINFTASKNLKFGKFNLENQVSYQAVSDEEILPYPELIIKETFYFQSLVFNKALLSRLGFNVYYVSQYKAFSYMPALAQFHLQQNDNAIFLGNYPVIDFFIDMKVKRMKIFLMLSHFNEGMSGNDYYYVPGYPIPPRAFKFGVNWNFLN